ncbi:MAG TPA: hypothetical protein VK065_01685 [Brevibacterium sp.]|nr:hypothetical protein [Brevibacterium sp.]
MKLTEQGIPVGFTELAGAVYDHLSVKPGRTIVAPGASVAWDDCCKGQLWVRVITAVPGYQGRASGVACPTHYDLTLGVGIVRCVSTVDDRGRPPSAAQITTDGNSGLRDMREIADILQSYRPVDALTARLGNWTPSGPDGGCAGGEWSYQMRTGADL